MTQNEILNNCKLIQAAIDLQVPTGDIDSVEGKMIELVSLMGLSAETMKEAQYHLLIQQGLQIDIIRKSEPGISATNLKMMLGSKLAMESTMYEYAERLNAAITHAVDGLRTSISKYKMEREIARYEHK